MLALLTALLLTSPRLEQPAAASGGGYTTVQDEGTPLTQRATINFTGAGISCSDFGGITVCVVSGGGGGGNWVSDVVTFTGGYDALRTVTAAWATGSSTIICHADGEEASVEGLDVTVISKTTGSFVIRAEPRTGRHNGPLPFTCTGQ